MSDDRARELQEQGIQAAKAGDKDQARRLLSASIRLEPNDDTSWLWLASVARDKRERLLCLQKVLQINPDNEMGLKAVRALGVDPEQLVPKGPSIEDSLAAEDEVDEGPGVPMPTPDAVADSQAQAERIIQAYLEPVDMERIAWEPKTKRRAGEREVLLLRLQIGAAVTMFLVLVIGGLIYAAINVPEVQMTLFGPSATPTRPSATPTNTPTNTPGFDPTASPTRDFTVEPTFTPTPLFDPSITPWPTGFVQETPRPTDLYLPEPPSGEVATAAPLIEKEGAAGAEEALPLLERARFQQGDVFEPNPYYYGAIAYITLGRYDEARTILEDAQSRLDNLAGVRAENADRYQPLINLGFAQLDLAEAAVEMEEIGGIEPDEYGRLDEEEQAVVATIEEARTLTQAARQFDARFAQAYIVEAQAYQLEGNDEAAIAVLDESRDVPELRADVEISITRGNMLLDWGRSLVGSEEEPDAAQEKFAAASFEGYYATYLNPFVEEAHQLSITAAIENGEIGLAAIRCEDYLLYFPNSPEAFRLFGDVRAMQDSTEFALYNYSQALASDTSGEFRARTLASRSQVYVRHHRSNLALDDLNESLNLDDTLTVRALRLKVAYDVGDYDTAREDAEELLDSGILPNADIWLIQARMLVDEAGPEDRRDLNRAIGLLNQVEGALQAELIPNDQGEIDPAASARVAALMPVVDEYRAWASYGQGLYGNALEAVNQALAAVETGSRHYLRGLIYEAQGDEDAAIADYQWVLAWDKVMGYPFADDAQARIQGIYDARAAVIATATAEVVQATEQANATATAEAAGTATAEYTPEVTAEATSEATPESTPEAEPTDSG